MFIDGRDNQIHQSPRGGKAGKRDCFSLQRSVMSIEGRLVQEQHSSGVQCGGCLNQEAPEGLKDSQD